MKAQTPTKQNPTTRKLDKLPIMKDKITETVSPIVTPKERRRTEERILELEQSLHETRASRRTSS